MKLYIDISEAEGGKLEHPVSWVRGKLGAKKLEVKYCFILSPLLKGSTYYNGISLSRGDPLREASCNLPKVMQESQARSRNEAVISWLRALCSEVYPWFLYSSFHPAPNPHSSQGFSLRSQPRSPAQCSSLQILRSAWICHCAGLHAYVFACVYVWGRRGCLHLSVNAHWY